MLQIPVLYVHSVVDAKIWMTRVGCDGMCSEQVRAVLTLGVVKKDNHKVELKTGKNTE